MTRLLLLLTFGFALQNLHAQNWTAQTSGTTSSLVHIAFIDSLHGWAFGAGGTVLKTSNGGVLWRDVSASSDFDIRAAYAFDTNIAVAVGEYTTGDGFIIRTTDGGTNWSTITSSLDERLLAVHFSGNNGWAVGRKGELHFSSNKGASWSPQNSPSGDDLEAVFAVSSSTAWIAGEDGAIYKTTNSGSSWSGQSSGTNRDIYSLFFLNTNDGWAGGKNGTLLQTGNGGSSWSSSSPASNDVLAIQFASANTGWIGGESGTLYKTSNGGSTWTAESAGSGDINSLSFTSASRGWLAASGGAIYRYETVVPITADFSSTAPVCAGVAVNFTDNSTGNTTEWDWDFGDGTTSTAQNPSHIYSTSGQFEVTLTVRDAQQNEASTKKFVEIASAPQADFIATKNEFCLGDSVEFISVSSSDVSSHTWNFGDGAATGTGANIGHLYLQGGTYNVQLVVANAGGCTDTAGTQVTVDDISVTVSPANVTICSAGDSVLLTASGAGSYVWEPASSVRSPKSAATYAFPSVTTVYSVIGTSTSGCSDTAFSVVTISSDNPPVADFEVNTTKGCVPFNIKATNLSTSATGYKWQLTGSSGSQSSAAEHPNFHIDASGLYTIMLVAKGCGQDDTLIRPQYIRGEQTPVAAFTISVDTLDLKFTNAVSFTNQSTQTLQPSWNWDFGNGTTSSLESPVATYSTSGSYDVALVVVSSNGCSDTAARNLKVINTTPEAVIENSEKPSFAIYPVPAQQAVMIDLPGDGKLYTLRILAIDGKEAAVHHRLHSSHQSISLDGMEPGIYFYQITTTGGLLGSGKLVIQ